MAAFVLGTPTKVKPKYLKKVHSSDLFVMIYEPEVFCVCGTLYNEKQFLGQKCRRLQACLQETLWRPASE